MHKQNCWEFMGCAEQGVVGTSEEISKCAAMEAKELDGLNGGQNGGRICWAVAGTFCQGVIKGLWAKNLTSCLDCEFMKRVMREEGDRFQLIPPHSAIT